MKSTGIRDIIAEEKRLRRHKEALDALVQIRSKLLHESLKERMRRAQDEGEWSQLSQKKCAGYHKQEKLYLKSQVDRLRHEQARTKGMLSKLRGAKARAERILTAEVASTRKRQGIGLG